MRTPLRGIWPLALLIVCLSAGPASAAKPLRCAPGQVVVRMPAAHNSKKVCKALAPARTPAAGSGLALARKIAPSVKRLRAAAPARLRPRFPTKDLTKLEQAMRRALVPAAGSARFAPRAAQDCDGQGDDSGRDTTTKDGVTVTGSASRWGNPLDGATSGSARDLTVTLANGASKRDNNHSCTSWDSCPDANGDVPGRYTTGFEETRHVEKDGLSLDLVVWMSVEADLVAHVGDDARLTTFDWTATATGGVKAVLRNHGKLVKYYPDSNVRLVLRGTGADPRNGGKSPAQPDLKAWGPKTSLLDGANSAVMDVARGLASFAYVVPGDVSGALLNAEKIFYDQAACVDVVFDPPTVDVQPGGQVPVGVALKAKDGGAVAGTYTVTPSVGSVAAVQDSAPGTITYVAPDPIPYTGVYQDFQLEARSKRGRALGTHRARPPEQITYWNVTFSGSGSYTRHEGPQMQTVHDVSASFSWTTTWKNIPVGDQHPAAQTSATSAVSGTWQDAGRFGAPGSGDFVCSGALTDEGDSAFAEVSNPGSYVLRLWPFAMASSAGSDPACTGLPGAPWADVFLTGDMPALQGAVTVDTSAQTGQSVHIAVRPSAQLATDCRDLPSPGLTPCTHSVDWSGTITMTKAPPPS
jgi:hypothetical protein